MPASAALVVMVIGALLIYYSLTGLGVFVKTPAA